jgi:phasin
MTTGKTPGFEIPDQMRDLADRSVEQARKAFDEYMVAARKAVGTVEEQAKSAKADADSIQRTALEYSEENIAAAFELAQKMVRAGDVNEMMKLQSDYLRKQMESLGEQVRDLGDKASKAAQSAAQSATRGGSSGD